MKMRTTFMFLSLAEVAQVAGVSRAAVLKWVAKKKLRAVKVGRAYVVRVKTLNAFLARREAKRLGQTP